MSYKLFLDDLRTVQMVFPDRQENEFVVVRSYGAFVDTISTLGLPTFISFDNDLGEDEAGRWRQTDMPQPNGLYTNPDLT